MFSTFLGLLAAVALPLGIELFLGPAPRALLVLGASRKRLYPYQHRNQLGGALDSRQDAAAETPLAQYDDFFADQPGMPIEVPQASRKRPAESRRLQSMV